MFPESVITNTFQSDDDVPDEEITDNIQEDKFKVLNDSWDDLSPEETREKEKEDEA